MTRVFSSRPPVARPHPRGSSPQPPKSGGAGGAACRAAALGALWALLLFSLAVAPAKAQFLSRRAATFASHEGTIAFLGVGVAAPLWDTRAGERRALQSADALVATTLLVSGLKLVTRQKRPDTGERNSFPSGHAAAAFTVATVQASFHPDQAPLWFVGAGLIGASRVRLKRHFVRDVVAGAALGYAVGRWELSRPRGLILPVPAASSPHATRFAFSARF